MTRASRPTPRPVALAAAAAALALAGPASAQSSPYYIGGSVGLSHDSNIFRIADGESLPANRSKSDTVTTLSVIGGVDQQISRQRVRGSFALRDNRYADNSYLDNRGYGVNANWDWATVGRLSGTIGYAADRSLASYDLTGRGNDLERNLQTAQRFNALARLGVVTRWTFETGLNWRKTDYSLNLYDYLDNHQTAVFGGVRYRPSDALDVGAALRGTEGRYPRWQQRPDGSYVEDRYQRRDVDFTANWRPRGNSIYSARVSVGRTEYDEAKQRDFSGVTGDVSWLWQASGKVRLRTTLVRDTGQDSSLFLYSSTVVDIVDDRPVFVERGFIGVNDYSRTTTALRLRADYAATAKIAVNAGLSLAQRTIVSTQLAGNQGGASTTWKERPLGLSLGATWTPTRTTLVGCDIGHNRLSADRPLDEYSANTFGCFAQLTLQP